MSVKQNNEDGNFIAKTEDKEAENKKETAEERMNRIFKEIEILKIKERSLAYEVGGTEKDYKKIQEKTNKDVDVWDKDPKALDATKDAGDSQGESSNQQSFIHSKKRRKKGGLGAMILNKDKAENSTTSHVEALKKQRLDKSKGGGGNSL